MPVTDRSYLREAAVVVESKFPDNHGFILIGTEFENPAARTFYTSNCEREAAIKLMKALLFRWGEGEEWMRHIK